jgi:hypothetical protein
MTEHDVLGPDAGVDECRLVACGDDGPLQQSGSGFLNDGFDGLAGQGKPALALLVNVLSEQGRPIPQGRLDQDIAVAGGSLEPVEVQHEATLESARRRFGNHLH